MKRLGVLLCWMLLLAWGRSPVLAQETVACPNALPIVPRSLATIIPGMFIRQEPSLSSGVVFYTEFQLEARVIAGPVCADGYNWWQVERQYTGPLFRGWVAGGNPDGQYIRPHELIDDTCRFPLTLQLGQAVQLYDNVRVRDTASLSGRVMTLAPANETVKVLEGAVCANNYNWWKIEVTVVGVLFQGWIVEDAIVEGEVVPIIEAYPDAGSEWVPCAPAVPLSVGDIGILRFDTPVLKNLHATPAAYSEVLYQLPSGLQLEILSGAVCIAGQNYRHVRIVARPDVEGWIVEGTWLGRFLGNGSNTYTNPQ